MGAEHRADHQAHRRRCPAVAEARRGYRRPVVLVQVHHRPAGTKLADRTSGLTQLDARLLTAGKTDRQLMAARDILTRSMFVSVSSMPAGIEIVATWRYSGASTACDYEGQFQGWTRPYAAR